MLNIEFVFFFFFLGGGFIVFFSVFFPFFGGGGSFIHVVICDTKLQNILGISCSSQRKGLN